MTVTTTATKVANWNPDSVKQKLTQIMRDYRPVLAEQLKTEINTVQFNWPRTTLRKNGQVAGVTRNIVDTGAFLASQRDYQPEPLSLLYAWGGPSGVTYAGYILTGAGTSYPARDWITKALQKQPLAPFIQSRW
jgi:hypothetical protein